MQRRARAGPLRGALLAWLAHHVTLVSAAHGFLTLERLRHPKPAASACACGSCWSSCRSCWPVGPAPVRCASVPRHGGSVERDDHARRPDRVLLSGYLKAQSSTSTAT